MPVLHLHLMDGRHSEAALGALLRDCSHDCAAALQCPVERVRVLLHRHAERDVAIGGQLGSEGAADAPLFEITVLEGRPAAQVEALLAALTARLVQHLGCAAARVRGCCRTVAPTHWGIGGVPASALRADEIAARAARPANAADLAPRPADAG